MEKNEQLQFVEMKFPEDKEQIGIWEQLYKDTEGMKQIEEFILENSLIFNLGKVIETNYEVFPIGDNEIKKAYVAKKEDGEIVSFVIFDVFDMHKKKPTMIIQYVVVNPKYQGRGYGAQTLSTLLHEVKNISGVQPYEFYSYINQKNYNSQKLFLRSGFELNLVRNSEYFRAGATLPMLEKAEGGYQPE